MNKTTQVAIHDLLWSDHPECCGCPTTGAEYMGQREEVCCGNFEPAMLNDKQIVASLRSMFPENAVASVQVVPAEPSRADYEAAIQDRQRLVRELDVLLNGPDGAAAQASLCDLVAQCSRLPAPVFSAASPSVPAVPQWMPIETAPKDGTPVLGWNEEFGWRETKMNFCGEGSQAYANWKAGLGPRESGWDWLEPRNNWGFSWKPTHWMPLPAAPSSPEGAL